MALTFGLSDSPTSHPAIGARSACRGLWSATPSWMLSNFTKGNDEEAHVAQPVRGLAGQGLDKEPEDGAQVTLASHGCYLDRPWHGRVAVAAGEKGDLYIPQWSLAGSCSGLDPSSDFTHLNNPQRKANQQTMRHREAMSHSAAKRASSCHLGGPQSAWAQMSGIPSVCYTAGSKKHWRGKALTPNH
jgi:hypothetical protein